jgi:hypothetical protein
MTNPVLSFRELMKRQARAAVAISGAEHSDWNGKVRIPRKHPDRGVAGWDGSLTYSYEQIKRPLREMFRQAGRQHDEATLLTFRNALKTILHENAHLLVPRRSDRRAAEREFESLAGEVLEEGITEAWAYDQVNAYIDELDLEKIAPGIRDVQGPPVVYARYAPAARELAAGVADRLGISGDEMIAQLNREDVAGKWDLITDAMFDRSELPRLVPESEHAEVKAQIRATMQERLEGVKDLTGANEKGEQRARYLVVQSALVGQDTYRAGAELVVQLEKDRSPRPGVEAVVQAAKEVRPIDDPTRLAWVATAGTAVPGTARPGAEAPAATRASRRPARRQSEAER